MNDEYNFSRFTLFDFLNKNMQISSFILLHLLSYIAGYENAFDAEEAVILMITLY